MRHSSVAIDPGWALSRGSTVYAIGDRPLTLGRQSDIDIELSGLDVSRLHAYLIPSPEGPMLIDRSRLGTRVNGERLTAPRLLVEGDTISVGRHQLVLVRAAANRPSRPRRRDGTGTRLAGWLKRYGPSEVMSTIVTVGATTLVYQLTGRTLLAVYLGTIADLLVYYGVMLLRETVREAHEAGKLREPYGTTQVVGTMRNLLLEFGLAEALDSGLVRPLCLGLGLQLIGGQPGVLIGKFAADLVFYGPVLAMYEWRMAQRRGTRAAAVEMRNRRTTAAVARRGDGE